MSILFEPYKIGSMALRNRFVRSATGDGCADVNGHVSETQIRNFAELAKGGVGLILTGTTYVHPHGQISATQSSIATDDCIPGLKRLTSTVHEKGAKIAVQLVHAGREAAKYLTPRGQTAVAPSFIENDSHFAMEYRALTEEEIREIIGVFGDAAGRARDAGFDAVQLHGAHAYLLSQFLSPYTNQRSDSWGGDLENRLRIHREIYKDIRAKVGEDYTVFMKLGVQDGFSGALEIDEGGQAARLLAEWGYDALEISQGLRGERYEQTEFRTKIDCVEREGYFREWCREIKSQVDVPLMVVGGLRTFELMEEIVRKKEADLISLCRPFIREPGIVKAWQEGGRQPARCISCNRCFESLITGGRVRCFQEKNEKEKGEMDEMRT